MFLFISFNATSVWFRLACCCWWLWWWSISLPFCSFFPLTSSLTTINVTHSNHLLFVWLMDWFRYTVQLFYAMSLLISFFIPLRILIKFYWNPASHLGVDIKRDWLRQVPIFIIYTRFLHVDSSVHSKARSGGKGDALGIVQEIEIWSYKQIVYAQTKICPRWWDS